MAPETLDVCHPWYTPYGLRLDWLSCQSIDRPTSRTVMLRTHINKKPHKGAFLFIYGAPETIRTSDLSLRRGLLYPAELPGHINRSGGAEEDRTPDLVIANDALSQLSYGPTNMVCIEMTDSFSMICHSHNTHIYSSGKVYHRI